MSHSIGLHPTLAVVVYVSITRCSMSHNIGLHLTLAVVVYVSITKKQHVHGG